MKTNLDDDVWYFCFGQSAQWWEAGQETLLFRRGRRGRDGARQLAFRSAPFTLGLEGALGGAWDTREGWRSHPAAKAATKHYKLPGGMK